MDVPYEQQFHCRDGSSIANLEQLKATLERISYQDFYHHVNTEKNDFANWIRHVLKEERLADDLQRVTSIVETVEILNDHLHPMPLLAPRNDAQSRIEQSILSAPLPSAIDDSPLVIETSSAARPGGQDAARTDFTVIEEKIGIFEDDVKASEKAREELFGAAGKERSAPAQRQEPRDDSETRLIIKDFVYGLIFGLIVGLIIGKII